jgi:ferredoxin-NADP reductase/ferredoxin
MSAKNYLPLLLDSKTILRTLKQVYGSPDLPETMPYQMGQAYGVADQYHPSRFKTDVVQIRNETESSRTIVLEPQGIPLPPWSPGQYVNLFVEVEGVKTSRPMSISCVNGQRMELTIKRKENGFVSGHLVDTVREGDELTISGPEGDFHYMPVRDGSDLFLIAAGSGITPFMGMIEHIIQHYPHSKVTLLYGSRSDSEIIFHDRLEKLAARTHRLELRFTVSRPGPHWMGQRGRINKEMIYDLVGQGLLSDRAPARKVPLPDRTPARKGPLDDRTFFVCGPKEMQRDVVRALREIGVKAGQIRVEASGPDESITQMPGWPAHIQPDCSFEIHLDGDQHPIPAQAQEPLMNALEREGITLPALCRSGTCGSCRTKLIDGEVVWPPDHPRRPSDESSGFIHPCVCHPVSDLSLRVIRDNASARLREVDLVDKVETGIGLNSEIGPDPRADDINTDKVSLPVSSPGMDL